MSEFDDYQRRRWMRPDALRFIRPDAYRFMKPGSPIYLGDDRIKYFLPKQEVDHQAEQAERKFAEDLEAEHAELLRLKMELAALRAEIKLDWLRRNSKAFNPNQPRVPAGNPDGGQWTSEGASGSTRIGLASTEKPRLGSAAIAAIATEVATRAIEAYRKANGPWDLFGRRSGTVTYTELNGETIFGSNSTSPTYTSRDFVAATELRDVMVDKYPDVMSTGNVGGRPNDSLFHAETTALLRAATANGGTLSGQSLEIHSDRFLCRSCDKVLPYVGLELAIRL